MERITVSSSKIRSIGYDPAEQVLEVEFLSGAVYSYAGVPERLYEELRQAPSLGKYFGTHVRDAGYRLTRLT